jgi:hypothetical protein
MAGNFPWGPASITANVQTATPALTIQPADTQVTASVDLAPVAAGFDWDVIVQYRKSTSDPWVNFGGASGVTTGQPNHDRQGNVVETGVHSGPFPDVGVSGRQLRALCTLGTSATLSGHITVA